MHVTKGNYAVGFGGDSGFFLDFSDSGRVYVFASVRMASGQFPATDPEAFLYQASLCEFYKVQVIVLLKLYSPP